LACDARNTTYEATSELAGLPTRYVNKLLAAVPVQHIGRKSLGPLMGAICVKLLLVEDSELLAQLGSRIEPRKGKGGLLGGHRGPTRHGIRAGRMRARRFPFDDSEVARIAQAMFMLKTTPAQRSAWARGAAKARWRQQRARLQHGNH